MSTIEDLQTLQLRVGTVLSAETHDGARKSACELLVDLGPWGEKQSSAQVTDNYRPDDLVGRQVVVVTGMPPRRVAGYRSDVLILGALTDSGVVLLNPDAAVAPGSEVA